MLQLFKCSSKNLSLFLLLAQATAMRGMSSTDKALVRILAENSETTRKAVTAPHYLQALEAIISDNPNDLQKKNMEVNTERLKQANWLMKYEDACKWVSKPKSECDADVQQSYKNAARLLEAYAVSAHLPTAQERDNLQAKLAQEHQQKEALRIEKDQIIAKQEKRGDIYKDSWLSAQSSAEQLRNDLTSLTARSVDLEANLNQAKETHIQDLDQIEIGLAIINQRDADVELQRRRIARMVELLQKATEDKRQLEEQQQKTLAQLEATRKQMAEQSSQSAEEYMKVRRQLSPLREERMHANLQTTQAQKQISNLQHLNAQLIRQLEEARQQLKEKNIIKKKNG